MILKSYLLLWKKKNVQPIKEVCSMMSTFELCFLLNGFWEGGFYFGNLENFDASGSDSSILASGEKNMTR